MNFKLVPLIITAVVLSVGLLIMLSLERSSPVAGSLNVPPAKTVVPEIKPAEVTSPELAPSATGIAKSVGFREYPIGDPSGIVKNHIRVAAVWLPSVTMEGPAGPAGAIHVEADITATEQNPNGFADGEFVPYLKINYKLTSADGKTVLDQGTMLPMVARDGLHYGTSMLPPEPGTYKLSYKIEPPSAGGLGRHHDPITGVAAWWEPFEVDFEWEYDGVR